MYVLENIFEHRNTSLAFLSLTFRSGEVPGTTICLVGAGIELLIARSLQSSCQVDEGVASNLERTVWITRIHDWSCRSTEVSAEALKVSLTGEETGAGGRSEAGDKESGDELHDGFGMVREIEEEGTSEDVLKLYKMVKRETTSKRRKVKRIETSKRMKLGCSME